MTDEKKLGAVTTSKLPGPPRPMSGTSDGIHPLPSATYIRRHHHDAEVEIGTIGHVAVGEYETAWLKSAHARAGVKLGELLILTGARSTGKSHMMREIHEAMLVVDENRRKMEEERVKEPELKGREGGNCNRTACQKPEAHYFNIGSRAYYCYECAKDINDFSTRVRDGTAMNLFPDLEAVRAKKVAETNADGQVRHLVGGVRTEVKVTGISSVVIAPDAVRRGTFTILAEDDLYSGLFEVAHREPKQKAQWKRERNGRRS